MPGYILVVQEDQLNEAFSEHGDWHDGWDDLTVGLRAEVANAMSSLKWDNREPFIIDPATQLTPVYMIAKPLWEGGLIELADDIAAVLTVKAFGYPSRYGEPDELLPENLRDLVQEKQLTRPMEDRLESLRKFLKDKLRTDKKVEVEFVAQRRGEWVGG